MEIHWLDWDDVNEAKLLAHGIRPAEVDSVITRNDWVVETHPEYPNQVRVIGPTSAGRRLTVVLESTGDPLGRRPVTGWDATRQETAYYREENR